MTSRTEPVLLIHAGASDDVPADEHRARDALVDALETGWRRLDTGASALDVVEAAVRVLEGHEQFNAGRGAVRARDGSIALDASIADGTRRRAGAVSGVRRLRHPVSAARKVLDTTPHRLLAGPAADRFGIEHGLETADPAWFLTEDGGARHSARHGTVGAVALDELGRVAAATSTGGLDDQEPGRVSDSAIFGAGTWADERFALSATGTGEAFVDAAFAHRVAMRIDAVGLAAAVSDGLRTVTACGGAGGAIAVTQDGGLCLCANTTAFLRGRHDRSGLATSLRPDEPLDASVPRGVR
jgi:beta-aspartyl-peptidase (threonine type)